MVGSCVGTSNPVAHLDLHWCLREVLASKSESITVVEGTDKVTINGPLDVGRSPVDGIGVPGTNGVDNIVIDGAVVGGGVSLSEEIALD